MTIPEKIPDTAPKSLLSPENITVCYGRKTIIRDISFDLKPGELCTLLGRNGSGKTTLLKAICGLIPVTGGRILSSGTDLTKISEKKRARYISYIPQTRSKLIGVTLLDAVLMGLNAHMGLFDMPKTSDREKALTALDNIGIKDLAFEDFSKLSEGQKQMVILARCILQNAKVMLMDEPDSSLDYQNKHEALNKIRTIIHEQNKAGLITLHDPELALNYSDRLLLLKEGRIIAEIRPAKATPEEIRTALSKIYENII